MILEEGKMTMGGYGSTRWGAHLKKTAVENCLTLDVNRLRRDGCLTSGNTGTITWSSAHSGEKRASIGFTAFPNHILLFYSAAKVSVEMRIHIVTTRPHFGGRRFWFKCPLLSQGVPCGRRVGMLYLPPGGQYFGCRACFDLTYCSCQEAHSMDREWAMVADSMGVPFESVKEAMSRRRLRSA
jgi:hypothetical protein